MEADGFMSLLVLEWMKPLDLPLVTVPSTYSGGAIDVALLGVCQ